MNFQEAVPKYMLSSGWDGCVHDSAPPTTDWQFWCRLCAKEDSQNNISVFFKSEQQTGGTGSNVTELSLEAAIKKYFWVNIIHEEELPKVICTDCYTFITSLVNFSDRVSNVQKLFYTLQNSHSTGELDLQSLRMKFGLNEGEGEHTVMQQGVPELQFFETKPQINELNQNIQAVSSGEDDPLGQAPIEIKCEKEISLDEVNGEGENVGSTVESFLPNDSNKSGKRLKIIRNGAKRKPKQTLQSKKNQQYEGKKRRAKTQLPLRLTPCPYCGKTFTSTWYFRKHIEFVHSNKREYICDQCGMAVKTKGALKDHMLTHTDYAPFECDTCKKGFKNKYRLKKHKEIHDSSKHICRECGLELNSRTTLNRHLLVHSDQMQHKCDYCGRAFKRSKTLKTHLILHTGLKPYSCDFCDRTFANGSNCRSHKKKAHPEDLAELEAAGGKPYTRNIPKLEALKAVTKTGDNLATVVSKPSGCFSLGKKPKAQLNTLYELNKITTSENSEETLTTNTTTAVSTTGTEICMLQQ